MKQRPSHHLLTALTVFLLALLSLTSTAAQPSCTPQPRPPTGVVVTVEGAQLNLTGTIQSNAEVIEIWSSYAGADRVRDATAPDEAGDYAGQELVYSVVPVPTAPRYWIVETFCDGRRVEWGPYQLSAQATALPSSAWLPVVALP